MQFVYDTDDLRLEGRGWGGVVQSLLRALRLLDE